MHSDLMAAVDAFDRVIAAADGLVDHRILDPVARTVREVRDRAGYLGDTLVGAVAGGTGSGKSSLINALADEVVTESGGLRPTTGLPVAWIPANPEPGLVRLLDDLGVDERVGQDLYPWLALLDLPDTDSVVVDHRHTVAALLPRVDLILWVIDPEKYQDRVLHESYLRPLAAYQRQFVFVLNQVDRLPEAGVDELVGDLASSLEADGIESPSIVAVAADPGIGPPVGVDRLIELLEATVDVKRTVYDKLATDLNQASRRLGAAPDLSGGVGFAARWDEERAESAHLIAIGDRRGAEARLKYFVADLAEEVGGGAAEALEAEAGPEAVADAVDVAYESSGAFRPPPNPSSARWVISGRWGLTAAALITLIWLFDRVRAGAGLVGPVALLAFVIAAWVALSTWSSTYRARVARDLADERRRDLIEPISHQLELHLGGKLRMVLRRRAGATAAATELNLALVELERRLS